ncbi:FkbM family methyltransferase [Gloeothece verrucosa]|uniref:Methyltransferase FkbM family n=1 Tax=Gloeothece verrucosa (strain PCC 7822) TaxID=497965 RepID=E0UI60_GLOV7|nr:FkbM family methyltransferase [Gloeothece verrucosa]ADN15712.1 methyltransferase FkbM family [Gloeothece verrucosa PCC 7822]
MKILQNLLLLIYSLVNKSGLFKRIWLKKIFYFAYFLYKQYFEDPFFGLTQKYPELFRGGHILDVGANIGYTATIFAKVIAPEFKIYAFEPDEKNFNSLQEIIKFNHQIEKIIAIQSAVGEREGLVNLWHNDNHHGDHKIVTPEYQKTGIDLKKVSAVSICSIDHFVESRLENAAIKFMKIDVQGYELAVCRGMEKTLMANPDAIIALEYMPSSLSELGFDSAELLQFFRDKNYYIYILSQRGNLAKADRKLLDTLVKKRGYIDLLLSKKELREKSSL